MWELGTKTSKRYEVDTLGEYKQNIQLSYIKGCVSNKLQDFKDYE